MTLKNNPWDHLGELVGTIASLCGCDVEGGSEGAGVGITESLKLAFLSIRASIAAV